MLKVTKAGGKKIIWSFDRSQCSNIQAREKKDAAGLATAAGGCCERFQSTNVIKWQ